MKSTTFTHDTMTKFESVLYHCIGIGSVEAILSAFVSYNANLKK